MKMTSEHFAQLEALLRPHDTAFHRDRYAVAGHSTRRYQWDLVRHAGALPFICDSLYQYLNDDHIQTALNRIIKPLEAA